MPSTARLAPIHRYATAEHETDRQGERTAPHGVGPFVRQD
jgi:hypothetical protein